MKRMHMLTYSNNIFIICIDKETITYILWVDDQTWFLLVNLSGFESSPTIIIIKYLYSYTHKNIKYLNAVYIDLH